MQKTNDEFDLEQRITVLETLLRACYPYVQFHYERSAAGFGKESKELLDAIDKILEDV